ncbi:MAG: MBL fold metallo-hydrolase [Candidatus Hodarchaeales archaeon]|jgi:glyoxylase-like metal-dependent hydrolase (beta-lactamase superfamily II)
MEKIGSDAYVLDTMSHTALLTANRLILIDTAMEDTAKTLITEIKACGYQPTDIETIIITHSHIDHIGGLSNAKAQMGEPRIACHELEVEAISQQVEVKMDDLLKDGQIYQGLLVIHTPGHTRGNISLLDQESELLLVGDSFQTVEGEVQPMPDAYNQNPTQHRHSMLKLLDFSFKKAIVAHGHALQSEAHSLLSSATKKENFKTNC